MICVVISYNRQVIVHRTDTINELTEFEGTDLDAPVLVAIAMSRPSAGTYPGHTKNPFPLNTHKNQHNKYCS